MNKKSYLPSCCCNFSRRKLCLAELVASAKEPPSLLHSLLAEHHVCASVKIVYVLPSNEYVVWQLAVIKVHICWKLIVNIRAS